MDATLTAVFDRSTWPARQVLMEAQAAARSRGSSTITAVHLLLGIIRIGDSAGVRVLRALGVHPDALFRELDAIAARGPAPEGTIPFGDSALRTLERFPVEAQRLGHEHRGTEHLLLAAIASLGSALPGTDIDIATAREAVLRLYDAGMEPEPSDRPSIPDGRVPGHSWSDSVFAHLDRRSRAVLERAAAEARGFRHGYIGTEHLLLGILADAQTSVSMGLYLAPDAARHRVRYLLGEGERYSGGHLPFSARAREALEHAVEVAREAGDPQVRPEHLLRGLLREGDAMAVQVLDGAGVNVAAVLDRLPERSATTVELPVVAAVAGAPEPDATTVFAPEPDLATVSAPVPDVATVPALDLETPTQVLWPLAVMPAARAPGPPPTAASPPPDAPQPDSPRLDASPPDAARPDSPPPDASPPGEGPAEERPPDGDPPGTGLTEGIRLVRGLHTLEEIDARLAEVMAERDAAIESRQWPAVSRLHTEHRDLLARWAVLSRAQERRQQAAPAVPAIPETSGRLPDPARSAAVLIGTADYDDPDLPDLPAVRGNLLNLADILADPAIGGFEPRHVHTFVNPSYDAAAKLAEIAEETTDTLVVYYAGHGLVASNGELYLGLATTRNRRAVFTALAYQALRLAVVESPASNKVVVLDCCFSGRAIGLMAGADGIAGGQVDVAGTYVLTATSATNPARIVDDARTSAFTGALLELLREGTPTAGRLLRLNHVYPWLRRTLTERGLPAPQHRGSDLIGDLALTRNPHWL
ncbi:hypothetical protein Val02_89860 [Virgisporangium aliadipatigenens]|uniref:Clp R domain-containing protein n=1 Tax=Virgisporangium aliadipatigenens TaxID=741659 RepID=A0A8J3YYM7_9ACTN|nr:Clp protease N-terminal domain-containing protein [Virgisporangium aliadipatigenens]GIJ52100.1 hypothetical protein Val02_89860 [Virgisporangium aliadipatigenens]